MNEKEVKLKNTHTHTHILLTIVQQPVPPLFFYLKKVVNTFLSAANTSLGYGLWKT